MTDMSENNVLAAHLLHSPTQSTYDNASSFYAQETNTSEGNKIFQIAYSV